MLRHMKENNGLKILVYYFFACALYVNRSKVYFKIIIYISEIITSINLKTLSYFFESVFFCIKIYKIKNSF